MSTASAYLTVRGIDIDVVFKDIKHLHVAVYPPLGRVRVAAPSHMNDEQVRRAVVQRLTWIRRQRRQMEEAARQSARTMLTGESHYVWGARRRLTVVERPGRAHVEVDKARLLLCVAPGTDRDARLKLLQKWQRGQLRSAIPELISTWEPVIGRTVPRWSIRRMRTKWGSCNRESGHLWFNLELASKHPASLEYIVVHEMTHLLERGHGERFTTLMDKSLPDWRRRREELNDAPLADEDWGSAI